MFKIQKLEITGFKSFADHTEIVFTGEGVTAIVGPNGCGKCVSGDTLITLSDGREVEIAQLVNDAIEKSQLIEEMDDGVISHQNPNGIAILSLNPNTLKLEPRYVSAFVKRRATPSLVRIKTKSGREVTATPYHPLFTLAEGQLKTLRADELAEGIRLALPRRLPINSSISELKCSNLISSFTEKDNVYVPYSEPLFEWATECRKIMGDGTAWARAAAIDNISIKGLLSGQSMKANTLARLASVVGTEPQIENTLKSRGTGFISLPAVLNADLAKFLGYLLAEGVNNRSDQVRFVNSDLEVNNEFERLAQSLFHLQVQRKSYKPNAEDCLIYSHTLCLTLERLFGFKIGSRASDKQIPSQILSSPPEIQWAFLSGLFEGDAHVCAKPKDGRSPHALVEFTTASKKLARQVVSLLLRLGVYSLVRKRQKCATNTPLRKYRDYYCVYIYGIEQLKYVASNLYFVGQKRHSLEVLRSIAIQSSNPNLDTIPGINSIIKKAIRKAKVKLKSNRRTHPKLAAYSEDRCEPSRNGLKEVIDQIKLLGLSPNEAREELDGLEKLASSDIYWDTIVSVENVTPEDPWVYDLSINETHNFVANNIVVHNSNVAESISWVLGEQRAKQLRGSEMKDVIFNGTSVRQPSGMAEVVLHMVRDEAFRVDEDVTDIDATLEEIDERIGTAEMEVEEASAEEVSDQQPPTDGQPAAEKKKKKKTKRHWRPSAVGLEFAPGETVTVTRRLYRSGESEYLLNGQICRLRDIQDLFTGTGLSGTHYAIIEQGRIGQILSAKPLDRRSLIEEAAGVARFRVRQRAAEARLESARANLRRVTDIILEIERQVGSLRRQAAKARRYRALREELRDLLRQVYVAEEGSLKKNLDETIRQLDDAVAYERELVSQIANKEDASRTATTEARSLEDLLSGARARAAEVALQRDRSEREKSYQLQQLQESEKRLTDINREIEALNSRNDLLRAEIERLMEREAELRAEADESSRKLLEAEESYSKRLAQVSMSEADIERARSELLSHTAVAERLMEYGRQLDSVLERLASQAEGLAREGERAAQSFRERNAEAEELKVDVEAARDKLETVRSAREQTVVSLNKNKDELRAAEEQLASVRDEFSAVKHRFDTLSEIDTRHSLYSESVQLLFSSDDDHDFHVIGTLADMFNVESQWDGVVEAVFGPLLQSVVVPTPQDAIEAASWLKNRNAGRANFLVAGIRGGGPDDATYLISFDEKPNGVDEVQVADILGAPPELTAGLRKCLPREMNARIVAELDQAIELSIRTGEMYVTYEGDWVVGGNLVNAGGTISVKEGEGLLAFKRELRDLAARNEILKEDLREAEERLSLSRERVAELEGAVAKLNESIGRKERELVELEVKENQLSQEIDRAARHMRVVEDETSRLAQEREDLEEKRKSVASEAATADAARKSASEKVASASSQLSETRRSIENEGDRLSQQRAEAAAAAERRRATSSDLRRMESEKDEINSRIEKYSFEALEISNRIDQLKSSIYTMEESGGSIEELTARTQKEIEEVTIQLQKAREQADLLTSELTEFNHRAAAARDNRAALDVERAELTARLGYLHEACMNDMSQPLEELTRDVVQDPEFELEEGRKRSEELRVRLEGFGAVNMMALEELAELEERLTFLTTQRQDITDGIATTEEAMREIKRRSRERFLQAFEQINANFGNLFVELFGGGQGEMSLIDSEDILESGIDIIAQPPGKKMQNVLLLSGGEKAMSALALVLAIFQYKPSPFCLLDEVDAPLDEANVGRFAGKISELSGSTQFIVITHNKRTMEIARALYGVTMQEAGVSKLVSVKFE
jgi:chromosome segregation protein